MPGHDAATTWEAMALGTAELVRSPIRRHSKSRHPHRGFPGLLLGQAMADVATFGLPHERVLQEQTVVSGQLQTALNSRIVVEQAKGLVAEQAGVGMGEAFELLHGHARRHNRRLRDVVTAVITVTLSADQLRVGPRSASARHA